jgi:hypothetical protein
MSDGTLTILNPQQVKVSAQVYLPGSGSQFRLLEPQASWAVANGATDGQWVAFFDPETSALLAAAALPSQTTFAQILLQVGITGLLRLNPQEPLSAGNGLDKEVIARLQNVGAASSEEHKLAPRGQVGSSRDFPYDERGQWLGFYDTDGTYITGTGANSFSAVTLIAPRQVFVVGDPYPVSAAGAAKAKNGTVMLTLPRVE